MPSISITTERSKEIEDNKKPRKILKTHYKLLHPNQCSSFLITSNEASQQGFFDCINEEGEARIFAYINEDAQQQ